MAFEALRKWHIECAFLGPLGAEDGGGHFVRRGDPQNPSSPIAVLNHLRRLPGCALIDLARPVPNGPSVRPWGGPRDAPHRTNEVGLLYHR